MINAIQTGIIAIIAILIYGIYYFYQYYQQYQFEKLNRQFIYSLVESLESSPNFTPAPGLEELKSQMKSAL